MSGEKTSILFNPSAGKGKALKMRARLEACLEKHGVPFDLFMTKSEEELKALAREHSRTYGEVAGAGGDSTFHLIANEILRERSEARVGLIALGSSNDIALEFGLETLDKSCSALKAGRTRRIDVGGVVRDGEVLRYYLGQANIGLGTLVNRRVEALSRQKPWLSRRQTLAGLWAVFKSLGSGDLPYSIAVTSEDGIVSGEFIIALFSNIRYWATGRKIAPEAVPDDGRLDACLIEPCSFFRLAFIASQAGKGTLRQRREIRTFQGSSFEVSSKTPFVIQADGEILGGYERPDKFKRVTFKAFPRALEIIA